MRILVRGAGALVWTGALAAVLVLLGGLGGPTLAPPPPAPSGWAAWATARSAVEIAFALGRVVVLALAGYLLVVTVLGVLAHLLRARPLQRVAQVVTLPVVRSGLDALLGMSLAAGVLTGPAMAGQPALAGVRDEPRSESPWDGPLVRLPAESPDHLPNGSDEVEAEAAPQVLTWTVSVGEHFWSIAEAVVGRDADQPLETTRIARYWVELVAANRGLLPDPSNPDLLYPGTTLRLPDRSG